MISSLETSGNTAICQGETTDITINFTGTAPCTFIYTHNDLNPVTVSTNENSYNLTVSEAWIYRATAVSSGSCFGSSITGSAEITINQLPGVDLGQDLVFCKNCPNVLDAGPGFASYLWNDESTAQTITVYTSGNYSVTVTDENNCQNSDTINVIVNPVPRALIFLSIQIILKLHF